MSTYTYKPRQPQTTVLYETVRDYLDEFLHICQIEGKKLPAFIEDEFRSYLTCGVIQYGFVRRKCEDCGHEELTPFSCKKRGFCPSCCSRRMAESVIHLVDNVLPERKMRQWVVTLPIPLRYIASTNKDLQAKIHDIIMNEIHRYYTGKSGLKQAKTGSITFIQRFATLLNLNPHFHIISIDGVYFMNTDNELSYKNIAEPSQKEIHSLLSKITTKVVKFLRKKGILKEQPTYVDLPADPFFDESPALGASCKASIVNYIAHGERSGKKVRFIGSGYGYEEETPKFKGRHCVAMNGFSLHAATRIRARDRKGLENLLMYMARGPIATERLERNADGNLLYKLKRQLGEKTHILLSPLELLEKISSLIPPPGFHGIRYNGLFAPGAEWRDKIVKALKKPKRKDDSADEPAKPNRTSWSTLLKRVFNLDLDFCQKCGGKLKFISAITQREVIHKILDHLGIPRDPPDRTQRSFLKNVEIIPL